MRFFSRFTAAILCMVLLIASVPFTASALEVNGYVYEISEDGTEVTITGYTGTETALVIPAAIDGLPVTRIDRYAFQAYSKITEVTIPASVKSIGSMAFYNCLVLETINISPYTYTIGYQAFHNTAWYVNAQNGPLYLGRVLYSYVGPMSANTTLTIEYGTASIAPHALAKRTTLKAVYLPVGMKQIGDNAFLGCTGLDFIRIPPSVTEFGVDIFFQSSAVTVNGVKGSQADVYAMDNKAYFTHDETLDYPDGDMNKDGVTNSSDYRILMRIFTDTNITYDVERFWSCDAVYDGTINSADVRAMLMASIGL